MVMAVLTADIGGERQLSPVNILLAGVWAFAIIWLVGTFVVGGDLLVSLVVFFIAIGISATAIVLPKGSAQAGQ